MLLVFYGAHDGDAPIEVHVHVSGREVVHRPPRARARTCGEAAQARRDDAHAAPSRTSSTAILDALTDSLLALARPPRRRDRRARGPIASSARPATSAGACASCAPSSSALQQVVTPQRDMLARGARPARRCPGLEPDVARDYFRDVYDHLVRIAEPDRLLPRPALRRAGRLPLDGLQPAQRDGEAAHDRRHDLPAADRSSPASSARTSAGWCDHIDSLEAFLVLGVGGMILAADRRRRARCVPASAASGTPAPRERRTRAAIPTASGPIMAVDLTQVATVETEPGELPATMAAWVIREEREGEPIDAFQLEEIEVPEPGAFEVDRPRDGRRRELQQRLGGARRAGLGRSATTPSAATTSAARTPPASSGRSARASRAGSPATRSSSTATRPPTRTPRSTASTRWPRRRSRSGATRRPGARSPSSPRSRPSSCCPSPRT